jgi:uncharacterized membrane protein YgdD (TMEM256/DUF423 family)
MFDCCCYVLSDSGCGSLTLSGEFDERDGGRAGSARGGEGGSRRGLLVVGALLCGFAVAMGAFGAHALKARLAPEALGWWQTAVQYQMWHGLALVALGAAGFRRLRLPAWLLGGGALIFSATLYAMALGAPHWLGAVTPLGGLAMIAGWGLLAFRAIRPDTR